jgi:hypothetical protein
VQYSGAFRGTAGEGIHAAAVQRDRRGGGMRRVSKSFGKAPPLASRFKHVENGIAHVARRFVRPDTSSTPHRQSGFVHQTAGTNGPFRLLLPHRLFVSNQFGNSKPAS